MSRKSPSNRRAFSYPAVIINNDSNDSEMTADDSSLSSLFTNEINDFLTK